jgi:hypothetical protein
MFCVAICRESTIEEYIHVFNKDGLQIVFISKDEDKVVKISIDPLRRCNLVSSISILMLILKFNDKFKKNI